MKKVADSFSNASWIFIFWVSNICILKNNWIIYCYSKKASTRATDEVSLHLHVLDAYKAIQTALYRLSANELSTHRSIQAPGDQSHDWGDSTLGRNLDSNILFTLQYIRVFTITKGNSKLIIKVYCYEKTNQPDTGPLIHSEGGSFSLHKKRRGKHFSNCVPWCISISPSFLRNTGNVL